MERMQKAAVLLALGKALEKYGSWSGETHIQKAVYFLQELGGVPLEFPFILYKHGPYSFDLRDELTSLRADGLLEIKIQPAPYGPSLTPTTLGTELSSKFSKTLAHWGKTIDFIARQLGDKGVAGLERLATALMLRPRQLPGATLEERANQLHELKPHVPMDKALEAARELDEIQKRFEEIRLADAKME